MLITTLSQLGLAITLLLLGWWGRTAATRIVPPTLSEPDRARRLRVIGRGALGCQVCGLLFALATIPALFWQSIGG
jgi:hypothetical protein